MLRHLRRHARRNGILLSLALLIWGANTFWLTPADLAQTPQTPDHAACLSCHKQIVQSHLHTAHWLSSSAASAATIKGSFRNGRNRFVYNDKLEVVMEKKNGIWLQSSYFNGNLFEAEAFDIVIGSARKGQTYLYWDNNRLFQLPISYYTPADAWCNSPGYPTNLAYYSKQVPGQCMECHATAAELFNDDHGSVTYNRNSLILGIDCQRCHSDATQHIAWHTAHPADSLQGRYIVDARHLSRQQRLDACALCHSGFRKQFTPSFTFRVGDTLDKFSTAVYDSAAAANAELDVHGNQYGLLTSSKCFIRSGNLDCSSCHNVHVDEAGKMAVFSQRCISCHNPLPPHPGQDSTRLAANCIDCHMPALPSNKILLQLTAGASPVHDLVRTHHIAIYPKAK
jgi:nitrate/TMAO reductase-like tetraheme cytochrome c subunit